MLCNSLNFESCRQIMASIETGEETAITSPLTIAEIFHILLQREKQNTQTVKQQILVLLDCIGLQLVDLPQELTKKSLEIAAKYNVDFVDAANIALMQKHNIKEIYSLDEHYDKFRQIKRLTTIKK